MILLVLRFSINFTVWVFYKKTSSWIEATHVLVQNSDKIQEIQKLRAGKGSQLQACAFFWNRHLKYVFDVNINMFKALEIETKTLSCEQLLEK